MAHDKMFSQMNAAALARLEGRDPAQIARNAGVFYDDEAKAYRFSSMGTDVTVHYPDYSITPSLPGWQALVILHYLDLADGSPLTGEEIPFSRMRSGLVRGSGIDQKWEAAVRTLHNLTKASLSDFRDRTGAVPVSSNADIALRIPFLPRFPVTLKVWLPDEDFPASGRLFPDASADHYLTIEDAVTVAELLLEQLINHELIL